MNLALGAIFLAILLIPPLIFIYIVKSKTYARPAPKLTFFEYLILSAILSLFLHCFVINIFLRKETINYDFILKLLSGTVSPNNQNSPSPKVVIDNSLNNFFGGYLKNFTVYIFCLCIGCVILGFLVRFILTSRYLRMLNLVRNFRASGRPDKIVSYFNNWWYYFKDNEYNPAYRNWGKKKPFIYIDVLVDTNETTVLYTGILEDFITIGNELDRIYLSNARKRLFNKKDENQNSTLEEGEDIMLIPTGLFCLPYSNVLNLNLRYILPTFEDENITKKGILDENNALDVIPELEKQE